MKKKFIRQDHMRYSKLGKKRKKLQKWRKPKGRDSKMRLKRGNYPASPSRGYKSSRDSKKQQFLVYNLKDLSSLEKGSEIIIAKIGAKKKLDVIKKADEMKLKIVNMKKEEKK